MFLVRLIYASTAGGSLAPADYQGILAASIKNNCKLDMTGMLCCDGRYFLQCLEGSRLAVNRTYSKIISDPRHKDVLLLSYGEVASRHFGEWAMGYVALSSDAIADIKPDVLLRLLGDPEDAQRLKPRAVSLPIARAQFMKYSIKREFDPYTLTGPASLALLEDLSQLFGE